MPRKTKPNVVKVGNVSFPIYKHPKGWRVAVKSDDGKWKYLTGANKAQLIERARELAKELNNDIYDLGSLSMDQILLVRRALELRVTHQELDEIQRKRHNARKLLSDAIDEFLQAKLIASEKSLKNYNTLKKCLISFNKGFEGRFIGDIDSTEIKDWIFGHKDVSKRRYANLRSMIVTLFRWARDQKYLDQDKKTEAEKVIKINTTHKTPVTLSSAEMRSLLVECDKHRQNYIPWLVLTAFAGLRHEELIPAKDSGKPALEWSDVNWERKLIIVRSEISKTYRRVIPITPQIEAWLRPFAKPSGVICPQKSPQERRSNATFSVTGIISQGIGGWKINAPRKSFISYRAALVGLAQTAMEAGNSESEAKKSYNDAKGRDEAEEWFNILPENTLDAFQKVPKSSETLIIPFPSDARESA